MINYLRVHKTARVAIEGTNNPELRNVWLVAHGYGYLCIYFIRKFQTLFGNENMIIVPEGLHRYYLSGVSGRVGASWMTKEEREKDIEDYCLYLDTVYEAYLHSLAADVKVNALGFSQGGATICRWAAHTPHKIDNLILWGSVIPPDMIPIAGNNEEQVKKLKNMNWHFVAGDKDEFMSEEQRLEQLTVLNKLGIQPKTLVYDGGHDILEAPLLQLNKNL